MNGYAVDVPGVGTYAVTLALGDIEQATGPVTVSLEGQLLETVTTAAGEVVRRTYDVAVTDGQLTLTLEVTSGSAAIAALEVRALDTQEPIVTDTGYSYNDLGRLDAVTVTERFGTVLATPEVTDYVYDLIGNLDQVRLPSATATNRVIADYDYDDLNRLEFLRHFRDANSSGDYTAGVDALLAEYAYDLLPDGRRSGVTEKTWLDDGDGIFNPSELVETRIDWAYDPVGRLARESYDSHDDDLDYVTDYIFDLVGNRRFKLTDTDPDWFALGEGLPTSPDQSIAYSYDINDRLLTEAKDVAGGTTEDRFTRYEYGPGATVSPSYGGSGTQQTKNTVRQGLNDTGNVVEEDTYAYNRQGRLAVAVTDADGDDPAEPITSSYEYNAAGIRVHKVEGTDQILYLVDGSNPTGYAQILEETAWQQEAWQRIRAYTLGLDIISQAESTGEIYHLLYDGHGSTRALLSPTGLIIPGQIFAYDAYGNAHNFDPAAALTTLLYSGEQFDQRLQMQYLRARYYDLATGRFNRLDPFFGNLHDPLSLHKYLYAHAEPVLGVDPTGLESLGNVMSSLQIGMNITARVASAVGRVYTAVNRLQTIFDILTLLSTLADGSLAHQVRVAFNSVYGSFANSNDPAVAKLFTEAFWQDSAASFARNAQRITRTMLARTSIPQDLVRKFSLAKGKNMPRLILQLPIPLGVPIPAQYIIPLPGRAIKGTGPFSC